MNALDFKFGREVVATRGIIHDSMDSRFISSDFMEIDLDSGVTIAVWGDNNPPSYSMEVFRDTPDNHIETASASDSISLMALVTWLIQKHRAPTSTPRGKVEIASESSSEFDIQPLHPWYSENEYTGFGAFQLV